MVLSLVILVFWLATGSRNIHCALVICLTWMPVDRFLDRVVGRWHCCHHHAPLPNFHNTSMDQSQQRYSDENRLIRIDHLLCRPSAIRWVWYRLIDLLAMKQNLVVFVHIDALLHGIRKTIRYCKDIDGKYLLANRHLSATEIERI